MHHVRAEARADREGFMPPTRDWTMSPETNTTSATSLASACPLPQLPHANDSFSTSLPKKTLRAEEDTKPIVEEDSAEIGSV